MQSLDESNRVLEAYMAENTKKRKITFEWFRNLAAKGKMPSSVLTALEVSIPVMESVYESDEWDLQIWPTSVYSDSPIKFVPVFVIKYPEVTISNSEGASNLIKDIHVAIPIRANDDNIIVTPHIYGIRTTLSDGEYSALYLHSHLRTFSRSINIEFGKFCTGSDSLQATLMLLKIDWSAINFQMLLHQLDGFLAWESIEGGPHTRIKNISIKTAKAKVNLSYREMEHIYSLVKGNLHSQEFTLTIEEGRYVIADDEMFDKAMKRILPKIYLTRRGANGFHYEITDIDQTQTHNQPLKFVWKGESIEKVSIYNSLTDNEEDKVVHPAIKQMIIQKLEADLTLKTLQV